MTCSHGHVVEDLETNTWIYEHMVSQNSLLIPPKTFLVATACVTCSHGDVVEALGLKIWIYEHVRSQGSLLIPPSGFQQLLGSSCWYDLQP